MAGLQHPMENRHSFPKKNLQALWNEFIKLADQYVLEDTKLGIWTKAMERRTLNPQPFYPQP